MQSRKQEAWLTWLIQEGEKVLNWVLVNFPTRSSLLHRFCTSLTLRCFGHNKTHCCFHSSFSCKDIKGAKNCSCSVTFTMPWHCSYRDLCKACSIVFAASICLCTCKCGFTLVLFSFQSAASTLSFQVMLWHVHYCKYSTLPFVSPTSKLPFHYMTVSLPCILPHTISSMHFKLRV